MRAACTLALLVACATPDEPAEVVVDTDPLRDDDFAFCHREGVDGSDVKRWCELLEHAPPDACPGMRKTCAARAFASSGCLEGTFGGSGYGDAPDEPERELSTRDLGCDPVEPSAPGSLDAILRWGAALLAAVVVVAVARAIARVGWGRGGRASAAPADAEVALAPIAGDDDLPALPEDALLAEARTALAQGRLGDAVVWARGAALRRLARQGRLRLHRARTDREYLQAVRRDEPVADALAAVLRAVEDHRWAGRVLTSEVATAAVAAAGRLLAAVVLALVLLPGDAFADRYGPEGDVALRRLVEAAGWEVVPIRGDLGKALGDAQILVLDLGAVDPTTEDWTAIDDFLLRGNLLVLGGDPEGHVAALGRREPAGADDVAELGPLWSGDAGVPLPRWPAGPSWRYCGGSGVAVVVAAPPPGAAPAPSRAEPVGTDTDTDTDRDTDGGDTGDSDAPVAATASAVPCDGASVVQLVPHDVGWVLGLADASILRNAAMMIDADRRFLPAVVARLDARGTPVLPDRPKVVLATWPAGEGRPDPWRALTNARLLPFVLQLALMWALLGLAVGWPLSPLRDPPEDGRRDFGEHAVALGRHWRRVGATRHAAAAFARLELQRLGPDGIVTAAARAGVGADVARGLLRRVEALAADPDGPDRPDDIATVEELWKLTRARST